MYNHKLSANLKCICTIFWIKITYINTFGNIITRQTLKSIDFRQKKVRKNTWRANLKFICTIIRVKMTYMSMFGSKRLARVADAQCARFVSYISICKHRAKLLCTARRTHGRVRWRTCSIKLASRLFSLYCFFKVILIEMQILILYLYLL